MSQTYETHGATLQPEALAPIVSWSAVFGGALAALITHFLLNLLGLGLGAAMVDPNETANGGFSAGAFAWWSIAGVISAFIGGAVAGRLAIQSGHDNAGGHGLFAWALSSLFVAAAIVGMTGVGAAGLGGPLATQMADYNATMTGAEGLQGFRDVNIDQAGSALATGAIISFIALLIGAAAAWMGARWTGGRTKVVPITMKKQREAKR